MKIEELIKDLDPVTIIEFKNYIIEHLSDLCSMKNSNSKVISRFRDEEMFCEKCGCELYKNGEKTSEYYTDVNQKLLSIDRLIGIFNILKVKEAQFMVEKHKKNNR